MRGFIPPQNDEEQLLIKRVRELADISLSKGIIRSTGFLSDRQQQLATAALQGTGAKYAIHGGFSEAERQMFIFGLNSNDDIADYISCFSVAPKLSKMNDSSLTHRDFLGAFLSVGLKREMIGDIIVNGTQCVAFAIPRAANLIISELTSVGKYDVFAEIITYNNLALQLPERQSIAATLPSLRLDAILAAMLKISRSAAQSLIVSKAVQVNHVLVVSQHYEIQANDVFTAKGYGKYKLCEIGGKSRKDRVFIEYYKY